MSESMRSEFEALAKAQMYDTTRGVGGEYAVYGMHMLWEGFQLGYKAAIEAAAKVVSQNSVDDFDDIGLLIPAIRQLGGE